jgi:hypothetical protein
MPSDRSRDVETTSPSGRTIPPDSEIEPRPHRVAVPGKRR